MKTSAQGKCEKKKNVKLKENGIIFVHLILVIMNPFNYFVIY